MDGKIWSRNFVLLTLSNFLMYVTYYAIISALPVYLVSDLHAGKSQVGIVLAAYTIASVMIRPFSGFALDKFGRRSVYLIALLFYTMFFAGYLVALTIATLIILRFVQGLTWGVTTISGSTIAVDIIPSSKRGEGVGYFSLSTTLGMSIGPVIGLFICHHWGYMAMFSAGCFISTASLLCAYAMKLPGQLVSGSKIHFNLNHLFYRKAIVPSANLFIIMFTYGGMMSFIALYGIEIGIANSSLFFLVLATGIAASRLIAGRAFDRKGPNMILTLCITLLVLGFPILALVKNAAGFYLSAVIIGFGIGVVFPTFQTMVNNLSDVEHRGSANSTLYTALDVSMGLGMIISGVVAEKYSISTVFVISSLVCVAGLLFFKRVALGYYQNRNI
jgi:MFS family permease